MQRRALALWLALAASGPLFAASTDSKDRLFEPSFGDLNEELRQLGLLKKKALLLFFEQDDCPFCLRMHRDILSQPAVREMLRRDFHSLRIDTRGATQVTPFDGRPLSESAFAKALKVRGTPTVVAFDASGTELARLAGAPSRPEEFLLFGRYLLSGETARRSFEQFKSERRNGYGRI